MADPTGSAPVPTRASVPDYSEGANEQWEWICALVGLPAGAELWPDEANKDGRADAALEIAAVLARLSSVPNPLRTFEARQILTGLVMDHIAALFPQRPEHVKVPPDGP